MPPKRQLTKEKILQAALRLLEKEGKEGLTARKLAKELDVSTSPLFGIFANMEEIFQAAGQEIYLRLMSYQRKAYTENPFENMALGYVEFAREESGLFHYLIREPFFSQEPEDPIAVVQQILSGGQPLTPELAGLLEILKQPVMREMIENNRIYTHGLAVMVASGGLKLSQEQILDKIRKVGTAFQLLAGIPQEK